jgi:hypothetical protein
LEGTGYLDQSEELRAVGADVATEAGASEGEDVRVGEIATEIRLAQQHPEPGNGGSETKICGGV